MEKGSAALETIGHAEQRIVVIGLTGSGKTTLARAIAGRLEIPHVELDALHWDPGWTPAPLPLFRERVTSALAGERWVADGNYSQVRDIVWCRATTLLWLDLPLPLVLWRLLKRTLRRSVLREPLWNDNRESLRNAFLSRESLFLWALQKYPEHRKVFPRLFQQPEYAHLEVHRLRSPRAAQEWLERLPVAQSGNTERV